MERLEKQRRKGVGLGMFVLASSLAAIAYGMASAATPRAHSVAVPAPTESSHGYAEADVAASAEPREDENSLTPAVLDIPDSGVLFLCCDGPGGCFIHSRCPEGTAAVACPCSAAAITPILD